MQPSEAPATGSLQLFIQTHQTLQLLPSSRSVRDQNLALPLDLLSPVPIPRPLSPWRTIRENISREYNEVFRTAEEEASVAAPADLLVEELSRLSLWAFWVWRRRMLCSTVRVL